MQNNKNQEIPQTSYFSAKPKPVGLDFSNDNQNGIPMPLSFKRNGGV